MLCCPSSILLHLPERNVQDRCHRVVRARVAVAGTPVFAEKNARSLSLGRTRGQHKHMRRAAHNVSKGDSATIGRNPDLGMCAERGHAIGINCRSANHATCHNDRLHLGLIRLQPTAIGSLAAS
jgi:hypothetical protein